MSENKLNNLNFDKNIIFFLHMPFDLSNGGVTVQYYFADILFSYGINTKICNIYDNNTQNSIFNRFITVDEFKNKNNPENAENSIVIYCEGIIGNPLYAKYVIRWMLSKLGQNMPINYYKSWDPNELIYFFNTENELIDKNIFYKQLSVFYVNPIFKDLFRKRDGVCFTKRKNIIKNPSILHSNNSFEVTRKHTQNDYLEIFNSCESFISYDPLSFLSIIAAICGCISIISPIPTLSKKEYFKMTALYNYMIAKNIDSIYGIAYGNTDSELKYSKSTIHLVKEQLTDIQNWFIETYVISFIKDISNWHSNKNTLGSYVNSLNLSTDFIGIFDVNFYRNKYTDIRVFSDAELLDHYINIGKKQGRICYENYIIPVSSHTNNSTKHNIDFRFYRNHYKDLRHMTNIELIQHYNNYGIHENRFINRKQYEEYLSKH